MTIISILLAFVLSHFVRELGKLRRFEWLHALTSWCAKRLDEVPPALLFLLILAVPIGILMLAQAFLYAAIGQIGLFLLSIAVLVYTFGPTDLDTQVAGIVNSEDPEECREKLGQLTGEADSAMGQSGQARAVEAVFQEALRRWFGVIFWFAVLGVVGAVIYRIANQLAECDYELDDETRTLFRYTRQVMDWPVAQLMTLALALATDFDSVFAAWKQYHNEQGHGLFEGDNGFMLASARTIVLTGHAAQDGYADQLDGPMGCLQQAMDLVWRTLGVWLFALSILLLIDVIS